MDITQQEIIERMETLDGIDRGIASIESGMGIGAEDFFAWMEERHAFLRQP